MAESGYCMYLRKSRADREAEQQGEMETLARHEQMLRNLAARLHLSIQTVFREIVSGETIAARPMMQKLLREVEQNRWKGVLVVEVERLARGDTIDQGTVSRAFQLSHTQIITPARTYDPDNLSDQEYFEFGLFMSRREYQTIRRRLQAGREASVREGKYAGNIPPYGYERIKLEHEKGFTLRPLSDQASVVRMIFQWYVYGLDGTSMGPDRIARKLNQMGIAAARRPDWSAASVKSILENPVYIGKIRWNARKRVHHMDHGRITVRRPRNPDPLLFPGRHPPLIAPELFDLAQDQRKNRPSESIASTRSLQNPLAGLVFCHYCQHTMIRRPSADSSRPAVLICPRPGCPNISSPLPLVEQTILRHLRLLLGNCPLNRSLQPPESESLLPRYRQLDREKAKEELRLQKQFDQLCSLLEQGIYSPELFQTRQHVLRLQLQELREARQQLHLLLQVETEARSRRLPPPQRLLDSYERWPPAVRNQILKILLKKVIYRKEQRNSYGHGQEIHFSLDVYPRILPRDSQNPVIS